MPLFNYRQIFKSNELIANIQHIALLLVGIGLLGFKGVGILTTRLDS
jgi:hypothetical protein